jgi:hypothetical protein
VIRSLLSAIFFLVSDPTLEKVGSGDLVRECCHVTVRVFVLYVRIVSEQHECSREQGFEYAHLFQTKICANPACIPQASPLLLPYM